MTLETRDPNYALYRGKDTYGKAIQVQLVNWGTVHLTYVKANGTRIGFIGTCKSEDVPAPNSGGVWHRVYFDVEYQTEGQSKTYHDILGTQEWK